MADQPAASPARLRVTLDLRDWWVGYYRGDTRHYVCVIPCLPVSWPRGNRA